jgi:hypothetical protein
MTCEIFDLWFTLQRLLLLELSGDADHLETRPTQMAAAGAVRVREAGEAAAPAAVVVVPVWEAGARVAAG